MTGTRAESGAGDAELLARCRAGDQSAWEQLVERYSRYVYAIVVRGFRMGDHEAEDAFQDVFLRVYERLGTVRDGESLRPWIAQVTRRICIDRIAARERGAAAVAELEHEPADEGELAGIEEAMDVHDALAGLDPPCREMLDRFFARDEPYRVIAEALDVPMGTVASRISRCLGKLRDLLGEGRKSPADRSGG
jgi:RNA polymerase sigma factor (sigma-70 family)